MNCRLVAPIVAILFVGCASSDSLGSQELRRTYPTISFTGSYCERLTVDDVRQIVNLARNRSNIRGPVNQIVMENGPADADVYSGNIRKVGDTGTTFKVRKRNGQWMINDGSIKGMKLV